MRGKKPQAGNFKKMNFFAKSYRISPTSGMLIVYDFLSKETREHKISSKNPMGIAMIDDCFFLSGVGYESTPYKRLSDTIAVFSEGKLYTRGTAKSVKEDSEISKKCSSHMIIPFVNSLGEKCNLKLTGTQRNEFMNFKKGVSKGMDSGEYFDLAPDFKITGVKEIEYEVNKIRKKAMVPVFEYIGDLKYSEKAIEGLSDEWGEYMQYDFTGADENENTNNAIPPSVPAESLENQGSLVDDLPF